MQDQDQDTDDKYLSDLYAELKQEQPSSALDEKILAAARETVSSESNVSDFIPKKAAGPFSGRWTVPVSLAAVIVLSVTLVVMIERERPYSLTGMPEPTRTEQQSRPAQLARPAEQQPAKAMAKKAEPSAGEESAAERLQAQQQSESQLLQRAVSPPSLKQQDTSDSVAGFAQRGAEPVPGLEEEATAPVMAKAKPAEPSVPEQEPKKEVDVARSMTADSPGVARRPAQPVAPALPMKDQMQTPSAVVAGKDEPVAPKPEISVAASSENKAETESQPATTATLVEAEQPAPEKPVASAATLSATVPTSPQKPAQEVTKESSAAAIAEDQDIALTQDNQVKSRVSANEPAAKPGDEEVPGEQPEANMPSTASTTAGLAKNNKLELQCRQMSQQACLISPSCTLQQQGDKSYQCRAAANACETNFSQSYNVKDDCEKRPACQYVPADCYCAPGQNCACAGGPPAMCIPKPGGE
jgi:hypothetical protein